MLLISIYSTTVYMRRRRRSKRALRQFRDSQPIRALGGEERALVERTFHPRACGDDVRRLRGAYVRHGIKGRHGAGEWFDLIDDIEVKLHPGLRTRLGAINDAEVVLAKKQVIVLSLNGYTLADAVEAEQRKEQARVRLASGDLGTLDSGMTAGQAPAADGMAAVSAYDGDGGPAPTRLLGTRHEREQEMQLRQDAASRGSAGAIGIALGLAGVLICATFAQTMPALVAAPALILILGLWRYLAAPNRPLFTRPAQLRHMRGPLSLRAEVNAYEEQNIRSIAIYMGEVKAKYPASWFEHLKSRLPSGTMDLEMDTQGHVVRHGQLSIYQQRQRYPVVHWGRHATLAVLAALVLMVAWWIAAPLGTSVALAWNLVTGPSTVHADTAAGLRRHLPVPGDRLVASGTARCAVAREASARFSERGPAWLADCSRLTWGAAQAPRAIEIPATVRRLQRQAGRLRRNQGDSSPARSALQRALERVRGDHFLAHFPQLTEDAYNLCERRHDRACRRLRSALRMLRIKARRPQSGSDSIVLGRADTQLLAELIEAALAPVYGDSLREALTLAPETRARAVQLQLAEPADPLPAAKIIAWLDEHPGKALHALAQRMDERDFQIHAIVAAVDTEDGLMRVRLLPRGQVPTPWPDAVAPFMVIVLALLVLWQSWRARRLYVASRTRRRDVARWLPGVLR
nr:IgaA/UmoB family intracellular growth attenuator [Oleiagrimonas sp. C23AA]